MKPQIPSLLHYITFFHTLCLFEPSSPPSILCDFRCPSISACSLPFATMRASILRDLGIEILFSLAPSLESPSLYSSGSSAIRDSSPNAGGKNGYNNYLILEEEGIKDHNVVLKSAKIQNTILKGPFSLYNSVLFLSIVISLPFSMVEISAEEDLNLLRSILGLYLCGWGPATRVLKKKRSSRLICIGLLEIGLYLMMKGTQFLKLAKIADTQSGKETMLLDPACMSGVLVSFLMGGLLRQYIT